MTDSEDLGDAKRERHTRHDTPFDPMTGKPNPNYVAQDAELQSEAKPEFMAAQEVGAATASALPANLRKSGKSGLRRRSWILIAAVVVAALVTTLVFVTKKKSNLDADGTASAYVSAMNDRQYVAASGYVCSAGESMDGDFRDIVHSAGSVHLSVQAVRAGPNNPANGNIWLIIRYDKYTWNMQMGQTPAGKWLFCDDAPTDADDH